MKKMNGDRGLMRAILSLQGRQRTSEQVSRAYITKKTKKQTESKLCNVSREQDTSVQIKHIVPLTFPLFTHTVEKL